jgi:hypothetical protein
MEPGNDKEYFSKPISPGKRVDTFVLFNSKLLPTGRAGHPECRFFQGLSIAL